MFMRLFYSAAILVFCVMSAGCAGSVHSTGGVNDALRNEIERLRQENEDSRRIIGEKQSAIDKMNIEMTNLRDQVKDLRSEVVDQKQKRQHAPEAKQQNEAGGGDGFLKDQISTLKEKTISAEEMKDEISIPEKEGVKQEPKVDTGGKDVVQTKANEKRIGTKVLRIKVLSGDGNTHSAEALSEKLTKLGYRVENVGLASRSNFDVNTIYFASDYKNEAQQVAAQLGGGAMIKPLTWSSVFHMIVVTGH